MAEDVFLIKVLKDYKIEQNGHEKRAAAPINPYHMHININPFNKTFLQIAWKMTNGLIKNSNGSNIKN